MRFEEGGGKEESVGVRHASWVWLVSVVLNIM